MWKTPMPDITYLKAQQEQRLAAAVHAMNNSKRRLRDAIGDAEACERAYKEIADDVRRRLEAIALVAEISGDSYDPPRLARHDESVEDMSNLMIAAGAVAGDGGVRTTSRPLFSSLRRAKAS